MKVVKGLLLAVFILSLGLFGVSQVIRLSGRDVSIPQIASDREVLELSCAYEPEQLLEGMSAYDEEDGDLTGQIIPGTFSRFIQDGVCNLTYVVFDSANHAASLTRKVRFTDYHSPRFTLTEPLVFQEDEGSYSKVMERLGAEDLLDGDLKEWIIQTDTDAAYSRVGNYTIMLEVSNSLGDISTAALPVHVVSAESQSIDIVLTQGIVYLTQGESFSPEAYVDSVTDRNGDELGMERVWINSTVDSNTPGLYEVQLQAEDDMGGKGMTWLTVIVEGGEEA